MKLDGYTIRSISDEGEYYLVKNWRKNKALWVHKDKLRQEYLFSSPAKAKQSLTSLLKVMDEYKTDKFSVFYFCGADSKLIEAL